MRGGWQEGGAVGKCGRNTCPDGPAADVRTGSRRRGRATHKRTPRPRNDRTARHRRTHARPRRRSGGLRANVLPQRAGHGRCPRRVRRGPAEGSYERNARPFRKKGPRSAKHRVRRPVVKRGAIPRSRSSRVPEKPATVRRYGARGATPLPPGAVDAGGGQEALREIERPGRWRRGMHQRPGFQNGNKRSAVRKFDLGYSDRELPDRRGRCDTDHWPRGESVMARRAADEAAARPRSSTARRPRGGGSPVS